MGLLPGNSRPAPRARLGDMIFSRVAGPEGPGNRARIHDTPGPRWFGPERPIRRVHGDASMFIGGLTALLLQSLHPLAMAAVAAHSGFRGDPWGRLQRTSTFLAVTTYGPADSAQEACERVRAVHDSDRRNPLGAHSAPRRRVVPGRLPGLPGRHRRDRQSPGPGSGRTGVRMPARAASSCAANAMPRKSATAVRFAHSSSAMKAVSGP